MYKKHFKNYLSDYVKLKNIVPYDIRLAIKRRLDRISTGYLNLFAIDDTLVTDFFIVGYPKSGNTWLQNIIVELKYGIDASLISDSLLQDLVPDVHYKRYYNRFAKEMIFKSHFLPRSNYHRVIYLARDGRDVMVSYYHYLNALGHKFKDLNNLILCQDRIFPSSWSAHVQSWLENPYGAEMLIIRYEDLLSAPNESILKIVRFLSLDIPRSRIESAIERTSFNAMKIKERNSGWEQSRNWPQDRHFVRRGTSGSYKDEMTQADLCLFYQHPKTKETLDLLGYTTL